MKKLGNVFAAMAIPFMYAVYAFTQRDVLGLVMLISGFWELCVLDLLLKGVKD